MENVVCKLHIACLVMIWHGNIQNIDSLATGWTPLSRYKLPITTNNNGSNGCFLAFDTFLAFALMCLLHIKPNINEPFSLLHFLLMTTDGYPHTYVVVLSG